MPSITKPSTLSLTLKQFLYSGCLTETMARVASDNPGESIPLISKITFISISVDSEALKKV